MNIRHKIVLVDDNLATLNQGKSLLQDFYRVYTVQKAATLFENLEHDIPDLILLDVEMPEMDGFETIRRLKADPRWKDIPVIFLTAKSDEESERKGFSLGAVDYITKPFSGPLLQKRISNQILYMRVKGAVEDYSDELESMAFELARANERARVLMEKTPLCVRLWNRNSEMIDCNELAIKLFGFRNKQECLERYSELDPEYQPDGQLSAVVVKDYIKEVFETGVCEFQYTYKMPDGSLMPADVIYIRVEYENDYALAEYIRDMREHDKMMNEINKTTSELEIAMSRIVEDEQRMRLMLDAMPFACELIGENYKFIDCNEEALSIVGAESKEEYIEKIIDIIPEYQPCGEKSVVLRDRNFNQAWKDGYARYEWAFQRQGEEPIPVEITMVRLMMKGEVVIATYARDLREQKAIAEEIRRADIAEERSRAKSEFLATMSHEIRTPMNSIIGFSELALDMTDSKIAPEAKVYIRKIKDSAVWLLQIINDILDISKIESGRIELENEPFDLDEVLMRCQSVILPSIKEKGLELKVNSEPVTGKKLLGDPIRLYQVLINILYNAVKFTDAGTIIFSSIKKSSSDDDTTITFEVKDSGIGMDAEQLAIIFEPFIQADTSTTRKYGGTGLGLTISRDIVELMGGRLTVDSTPGEGSIFKFDIIFDTVNKTTGDADINLSKFHEKPIFNAEILVCDDNPVNQELICEHLARVGIKTATVENGLLGVELVRERIDKGEKLFDLVFMDIFMPVMDGIEAASKIKSLNKEIPIVALTANVMINDLENYRKNGMPDCLGKPFTTTDLWSVLLKYLKPVDFGPIQDDAGLNDDDDLQNKLRFSFAKNNQAKYDEISEAIEKGDLKLAHRLTHTLKGNAGQIRKLGLKKAAEEIETLLNDGDLSVPVMLLTNLKTELELVISDMKPLLDQEEEYIITEPLDHEDTIKLFDELEVMLNDGNAECIERLDDIRNIPGAEELVMHMEHYDFKLAKRTLAELKAKIGR